MSTRAYRRLLLLAGAVTLASCGGGGGGGGGNAPPVVLQIQGSDIAFDPGRALVYVATQTTDPKYQGAIVAISTQTDAVIREMTPVAPAQTLAVSTDGTLLFAGEVTSAAPAVGSIAAIALPAGTTSGEWDLPAGEYPLDMIGDPGQAESIAVSTTSSYATGADTGTYMYQFQSNSADPVVPYPNDYSLGESISFDGQGKNLYGLQEYQPGQTAITSPVYSASTVSSSGPGKPTQVVSQEVGPSDGVHWANGKMVTDLGDVLDPTSGTILARLDLPANTGHYAVPVPGSNVVYYVCWPNGGTVPSQIVAYDITTDSFVGAQTSVAVGGPVTKAIFTGNNSIALISTQGKVALVKGLPHE